MKLFETSNFSTFSAPKTFDEKHTGYLTNDTTVINRASYLMNSPRRTTVTVKYVAVEFRQTVLGQQELFQRRQAVERSDLDVVHSVRRQIDCRQGFLREKRTLLYAV